MKDGLVGRIAGSVGAVPACEWDRLGGSGNPFVSHAFLTALEDSGSVGPGTGWQPAPVLVEDDKGTLIAALPSFVKAHSQGEYVFDHAWADAYQQAGGAYYPKLQIAAPFTPATGPRVLSQSDEAGIAALRVAEELCRRNGLSSAHATFIEADQHELFRKADWMLRSDIQFHWHNRDYADFDAFLGDLASRKRKAVRKERAVAQAGLRIEHLSGREISEGHWDAFWVFYQDTGARKWGAPYLTREAFTLMSERMGDCVVLIMAFEGDHPIAGALNFVGAEALYGRYWGCSQHRDFLHFELCYYQAIEAAINRGLSRVEAGAQGGHKLARGYMPVETWSAHWIADPGFREAIADFLERERRGVALDRNFLERKAPYKKA